MGLGKMQVRLERAMRHHYTEGNSFNDTIPSIHGGNNAFGCGVVVHVGDTAICRRRRYSASDSDADDEKDGMAWHGIMATWHHGNMGS